MLVFEHGVRAFFDQKFHYLRASVHARHHERRCSVGRFSVDVSMVFKQQFDDVSMAIAGGIVQRRPTGFINVRAFFNQFVSCDHIAFERCDHQRAFARRVEYVQVDRSGIHQQLKYFGCRFANRDVQAVLALCIQRVGVKPPDKQLLNCTGVVGFQSFKKIFERSRMSRINSN